MTQVNFGFLVLTLSILLQLEWRLCYNTSQSLMNNTEIHNYSDPNMELNLTKLYDELIEILNTGDGSNISQFNNSLSRNRRIYFPGTLWCGVIKLTVSNDEIGYFFNTDTCCKEHELCPREKYYAATSTRPQESTFHGDLGIFHPRPPQTTIYYPTAPYPTYYPPPHQPPHYPQPPSPPYQPHYPPNYPQQPLLPPYGGASQSYYPQQPQQPIHLPQSPHPSQPIHYLPPPSGRKHPQLEQHAPLSSSHLQPTQAPIHQPSQNHAPQSEQRQSDLKSQHTSTTHFMPSTQSSKDFPPQLSQRMQEKSSQTSGQQGVELIPQFQNYTLSREIEKDLEDLSRMMSSKRVPKASRLQQRWVVGDSDCECDLRFYMCLNRLNNLISRKVGIIYFNLLHTQCVTFDHPVVRCISRQGFMGWRCIEYHVDTTKPMVSQWRDNPYFHIIS